MYHKTLNIDAFLIHVFNLNSGSQNSDSTTLNKSINVFFILSTIKGE